MTAAWEAKQLKVVHMVAVFDVLFGCSDQYAGVQDILQQLLRPRLQACLCSLFSSSRHLSSLQCKLDTLLCQRAGSLQANQPSLPSAHLSVVVDLLPAIVPTLPKDGVLPGYVQLLSWVLASASQLVVPAAVDPLYLKAEHAGDQDANASTQATASDLMQSVMQGCLMGFSISWNMLHGMRDQQHRLLATVNQLGECKTHPAAWVPASASCCDQLVL